MKRKGVEKIFGMILLQSAGIVSLKEIDFLRSWRYLHAIIARGIQDLAFAGRMLRKSPGFTFAAVLTLAVGIGMNVAIYSVIHAVLLSALPFPESDRLVAISETARGNVWPTSYPNYLDWKAAQHSFEEIAVSRRDDFNLSGTGEPERFSGLFVTASYFRVLKVPPLLGRVFYDEEDSAAGAIPIILSERLWRSRFDADPAIIGRRLTFNTLNYEVVGIVSENLSILQNPETSRNSEGVRNAEVYAPFGFYANRPYLHDRSQRVGFYGIARLKPGASAKQAAAELKLIARNLELKYPETNSGWSVSVTSLRDSLIEKYRPMLWLLEAAVALVLLITCANIANLLLVRTAAREKEIAMRAALGASRGRLIAQLLTESTVLALLGGALGCVIAYSSKDVIIALCPGDFPRLQEIRLDTSSLAFSALITFATSLLFGLGPAWKLSNSELITMSKSRGGAQSRRNLAALVIGQVAFASVLLMAAGLLGQTFRALQSVPLGFDPNHLLTAGIKLPGLTYHDPIKQATFSHQLHEKVAALPNVQATAVDSNGAFSGIGDQGDFAIVGQPEPRPGEDPTAEIHAVSPDYFRTMGIPLLRGRSFGPDDVLGKPKVVMIDEGLARRYFADQDPLGQQLVFWAPDEGKARYSIVGIVPTVRHGAIGIATVLPQLYCSVAQNPDLQVTLLVRTHGEPAALLPSVRAAVYSIDPQVPIHTVRTMNEAVDASLGRQRLAATLIGGFSILALFLAALGLYGVLAYSVTQRTREIGIRIALGSPRGAIFHLIVRHGMIMVALGIAIGLTLALASGPLFRHFVYGVAPHDPLTLGGASLVLGGIAILACWVPARRAAGVDPIVALRHE